MYKGLLEAQRPFVQTSGGVDTAPEVILWKPLYPVASGQVPGLHALPGTQQLPAAAPERQV